MAEMSGGQSAENDATERETIRAAAPTPYEDAGTFIRALVHAWDCCGTCAGGVLARRDRDRDARVTPARCDRGGAMNAKDWIEEHDFLPVKGHPDDDECTYRSDGTDATYCGKPRAWHEHHPRCYQNTGAPGDLPDDLCDCRVLRALQNPLIGPDGFTRLAGNRVLPPAEPTQEDPR